MTTTELEQLTESVANDQDIEIKSPTAIRQNITETPVIRRQPSNHLLKAATEFTSSTPMMVGDRLTRLKQEFNRCVADLKEKRAEITALTEQIIAKNRQIEQLKTDENRALIESTMAKENAERLSNRLKVVECELIESRRGAPIANASGITGDPAAVDDQTKLITKLEEENANFRKNFDHLNETIKELEDERDRIEEKYRESCQDIAELQGRLTALEATGLVCAQCETARFEVLTARQEYKQLKELYLKLHEENEEMSRKMRRAEVSGGNKEIDGQRELISSLEQSLQLAESKYAELTKKMQRDKVDAENRIQNLLASGETIWIATIVNVIMEKSWRNSQQQQI